MGFNSVFKGLIQIIYKYPVPTTHNELVLQCQSK